MYNFSNNNSKCIASNKKHSNTLLPKEKEPRKWNFWKNICQETITEFCRGTSLHGFRQIVDLKHDTGYHNLTKFLRRTSSVLWALMVFAGFVFAIYLIMIVLLRYRVTPTITTVKTSNFPISNIPFPGIMICDVNAVWKPNTVNITNLLLSQNINKAEIINFYQNLSALITFDTVHKDLFYIFDILEGKFNITANELMRRLAQPCENLLYGCKWLTKVINCNRLFRMARSELGYCCAFNYKALRKNIDLSASSEERTEQLNSPVIQIAGAGEDIGLRVFVKTDQREYISPKKYFAGAEIIVFDAFDYPQKNFIASVSQPNFETAIGIKPFAVDTEDNIRSFSTELRLCLFDEERNSLISRKYSFQSCLVECRALAMLDICKCLPFYYPVVDYLNNSHNYRICTFRDLECLSDNKDTFFSLQLKENAYSIDNFTNDGLDCDCLPSCVSVKYHTETFYMIRFNKSYNTALYKPDISTSTSEAEIGLVKVYYKQLSCIKYGRSIFMTWDNLLATIGGIFGLCLGGSVISLIEIGYYFTLKFYEKYIFHQRETEDGKEAWEQYFNKYYQADFKKPALFTLFATEPKYNNNKKPK